MSKLVDSLINMTIMAVQRRGNERRTQMAKKNEAVLETGFDTRRKGNKTYAQVCFYGSAVDTANGKIVKTTFARAEISVSEAEEMIYKLARFVQEAKAEKAHRKASKAAKKAR